MDGNQIQTAKEVYEALHQSEFKSLADLLITKFIFESGWFKSELSRLYGNHSGMKYRSALEHIAFPCDYRDWEDKKDAYCGFANNQDFVSGYIAFIGRWPYKGHHVLMNAPIRWLEFIVSKGYCTSMSGVNRDEFSSDESFQKYLAKEYTLKILRIMEGNDYINLMRQIKDA